jgi:preprotein translocase subunit YajC
MSNPRMNIRVGDVLTLPDGRVGRVTKVTTRYVHLVNVTTGTKLRLQRGDS